MRAMVRLHSGGTHDVSEVPFENTAKQIPWSRSTTRTIDRAMYVHHSLIKYNIPHRSQESDAKVHFKKGNVSFKVFAARIEIFFH